MLLSHKARVLVWTLFTQDISRGFHTGIVCVKEVGTDVKILTPCQNRQKEGVTKQVDLQSIHDVKILTCINNVKTALDAALPAGVKSLSFSHARSVSL